MRRLSSHRLNRLLTIKIYFHLYASTAHLRNDKQTICTSWNSRNNKKIRSVPAISRIYSSGGISLSDTKDAEYLPKYKVKFKKIQKPCNCPPLDLKKKKA